MDQTDLKILQILQQEGRMAMKNLGKLVGLSSPAVTERVRRLEETGVIRGYRADIDLDKVQQNIKAFITLDIKTEHYRRFMDHLPDNPCILECHHITGNDSMVLRVMVKDMDKLETAIESLKKYGNTRTNIILSTPVENRLILPEIPED